MTDWESRINILLGKNELNHPFLPIIFLLIVPPVAIFICYLLVSVAIVPEGQSMDMTEFVISLLVSFTIITALAVVMLKLE